MDNDLTDSEIDRIVEELAASGAVRSDKPQSDITEIGAILESPSESHNKISTTIRKFTRNQLLHIVRVLKPNGKLLVVDSDEDFDRVKTRNKKVELFEMPEIAPIQKLQRPRGRPKKEEPKQPTKAVEAPIAPMEQAKPIEQAKRGRGRPRKAVAATEGAKPIEQAKRGRGRPRKAVEPTVAGIKRGRGRPRKIITESEKEQK